ncbi:VOC family protein [Virgibacillus siamensis]|uniref:VOC family protein n=1 Tax=Virgibacillus siamensis TaxID=480071 RepID=UPI00098420C2|nr:VOC family protein [Virgibacillus siamensis]
MKSPIKNKVTTVFIPVRDIEKSKEWYSRMLGIEDGEVMFNHLFIAKMEGTGMILDQMPMWRDEHGNISPLNVPAIQLATDDVNASYQFMRDNDVEVVTEVMDNHWFVFKDPDGNMLMVCQDHPE